MPMFLDQVINFKPAREFHVCKITIDFLDDMNENYNTSIYIAN